MLNHVLKTIEERGEAEKQRILKAKKEELKQLAEEYQKKLEERKENQKSLLKKTTELEIQEEKKKEELKVRFVLERRKKELLDSVYQEAEKQILKLDDKEFFSVVDFLLEGVPKKGGIFKAGERTAKALRKKGFSVKESLDKEGFVFESEILNIDCALSQVLLRERERFDPKLLKILFEYA